MKNRPVLFAASSIVVAGFLYQSHRIHKTNKKIRSDVQLDILAIHTASDVVRERMNNEKPLYHGIDYWMENLNNEIAFQKIIIREK